MALTLALACLAPAPVLSDSTVSELLEEASVVSYTRHWQEAQTMLDALAPQLEHFEQRDYVNFRLLEARHLSLGGSPREALDQAEALLALPLASDQHLRTLQFGANMAVLLREYETAFDYLLAALALDGDFEDPAPQIATFNMASYMFGRVGEYALGIEYGERALDMASAADSAPDACVALQRLAPVYKWADQPERSEDAYRQGIRTCAEVGNELFVGVLQHGLADLLRRHGRAEEGRSLVREAILALQDAVYLLGEFEATLVKAEVLHDLEELSWPEPAEVDLDALSQYFSDNDLWDQAARLEWLQADLARTSGDLEAAMKHMERHVEAREHFLGRDRAMRLAYLQVAFDTRLKDQEIELLTETARAGRLEALASRQERRFRTTTLTLSAAVILLLALLLVRTIRSRRHYRNLSRHDALSGLANRGWFFDQAAERMSRPNPPAHELFFVVADIDHFKAVNDQFGHLIGDQVLGRTARLLRGSFGEQALTGRIGGEEFAILLWAKEVEQVVAGVERFVAAGPDAGRRLDPAVTVSFGIARRRAGDDVGSLRQRADEALYQAKREGRNRYVVAVE